MPPQTVQRYINAKTESNRVIWRFDEKRLSISNGKALRIELLTMATVHWSMDNWKTVSNTETQEVGMGVYIADLSLDTLPSNTTLIFTFHWTDSNTWEGKDFMVNII
jgi:glucoamylase